MKEYINQLNKEYIENHKKIQIRDLLIEEFNIVKRDVKGYHGREILELLQNAEDANLNFKKEEFQKSIEVVIEYKDNVLTVSNTGHEFTEEGIKSIVQGNNSPKKGEYIGDKGTGFRSVLNWSSKIQIFSGKLAVEFSHEFAEETFKKIKDLEQIKKQIKKEPNLKIPVLSIGKNIENINQEEYNTIIKIFIDEDKNKDDFSVEKQLTAIDFRILLFLPNIDRIKIVTEEKVSIFERTIEQNTDVEEASNISLKESNDDVLVHEENYYLFSKRINKMLKEDNNYKDVLLSIAVPKDIDNFKEGCMYSFFPILDIKSPFNCILHGTYHLEDNRNTIVRNKDNKKIFIEHINFLIDIAKKFNHKKFGDLALKLLTPIGFNNFRIIFPVNFGEFSLEDYIDKIKNLKILRTVEEKYISLMDNPKAFSASYPSYFNSEYFSELLLIEINSKEQEFIKIMSEKLKINIYYKEYELLEKINSFSDKLTIQQQVETFIWWNKNYKKSLPKLIKDTNDNYISFEDECYFLEGEATVDIPSWVRIKSLSIDYQKELIEKSKLIDEVKERLENDKSPIIRLLSASQMNYYNLVRFSYIDRRNIIYTVNKSVDNFDKAVEFILWLWKNYANQKEVWTPPTEVQYNFPSNSGELFKSDKLYFGDYYGNKLADKLFLNDYDSFLDANKIEGLENFNIDDLKTFISKFGVLTFPPITIQEISSLDSKYRKYLEKIIIDESGGSSVRYLNCKIKYIQNFSDILLKLEKEEVIEWISNDNNLKSHLLEKHESEYEIKYKVDKQTSIRTYKTESLNNYIKYVFNNKKWIEIGNEKYSPKQILFNTEKYYDEITTLVPIINIKTIEDIAEKSSFNVEKINEVFELFSFAKELVDLPSSEFYNLLLKLPELDGKLASETFRLIYRRLEHSQFNKIFEESENKKEFFKSGKLLVKYKGKNDFFLAKESYLPSVNIVKKDEYPIVAKGPRTGNIRFVEVFNCKEFKSAYKIDYDSIKINEQNNSLFQKRYEIFLKYAVAYGERNTNIKNVLDKLRIEILSSISIIEDDKKELIDANYTPIRESDKTWYIIDNGSFDINNISLAIEDIFENIANTPGFDSGKLGELFRSNDDKSMKFLIKKDFGSLDVINQNLNVNRIKENFIEAISKITLNSNINIDFIDFSNFYEIDTIRQIVDYLNNNNFTLRQLKEYGFVYRIDVLELNRLKIKDEINIGKSDYKNYLYHKSKGNTEKENNFIKNYGFFEAFDGDDLPDSLVFDAKDFLIKKFGDWSGNYPDCSEIHSKNYNLMNPSDLFRDNIYISEEVQTMIYFKREKEFAEWMDSQNSEIDEESNEAIYSEFKDVSSNPENIEFNIFKLKDKRPRKATTKPYIKDKEEKDNRNKKIKGNKAELIIYNYLKETYGEKNVTPYSEAFVELKIIKPGQMITKPYDIEYKEKGITYYVEVKSYSNGGIIITKNELEFAKQNSNRYKVFVVTSIEKGSHIVLPLKFWERSNEFYLEEIVERIECIFSFSTKTSE